MKIIAYCDGASNPKTKRSGIGIVFFLGDIHFHTISEEIPYCTNNESEYRSLLRALNYATINNYTEIEVFMDSKLVVEQVNERWKINYPHLQELKDQVKKYTEIKLSLFHIPRERNTLADKASKACFR